MSLNYPNREDWLAVRTTPRRPKRERAVHVSTNLRRLKDIDPYSGLTVERIVMMGKGNTYVRPEPKPVRVGQLRRKRLYAERMDAAGNVASSATDAPSEVAAATD